MQWVCVCMCVGQVYAMAVCENAGVCHGACMCGVCLCVGHVYAVVCMCGGQRTTLWTKFSLSVFT